MFQRTPRSFRRNPSRRRLDTPRRKFDSPLDELTWKLDRLESLVEHIRNPDSDNALSTPARRDRVLANAFRARRKTWTAEPRQNDVVQDNSKARFIQVSRAEEEEFVELMRRVAELVIVGEKAAAAALEREEKRREEGETGKEEEEKQEVQDHIALFEHFFERNALELLVNIVTGESFASIASSVHGGMNSDAKSSASATETDAASDSDDTQKSSLPKPKSLPPIPIATQAIQSVSILIQNVSRATSLYFLLSNNHINDLINLPLDLYAQCDRNKRGDSTSPVHRNVSPEISELSTHFITFLKSLALRMNAETLQFFLKYPAEQSEMMQSEGNPVSSAHFSSPPRPLQTKQIGGDEDTPLDETDHNSSTPKSPHGYYKPVVVKAVEVEFPLYARALEFCASHHDSFVRVTAMNICLNTLRLATYDAEGDDDDADSVEASMKAPDGILENADPLPIRERLAIAQHVCSPTRVESLVSPIFTKLAQLWGGIEEEIKEIDLLRERKSDAEGGTRIRNAKMEFAKEVTKRKKLTNALSDAYADLQDELLLLEDVFKVSSRGELGHWQQ